MTTETLTLLLIGSGAAILLNCIRRCYAVDLKSREFLDEIDKKVVFLSNLHHILMISFLVGYLAVFVMIITGFSIGNNLVIGLIFFFGAIFVFISHARQVNMLMAVRRHNRALMKSNKEMLLTQDVTIFALAYQAELRDQETGQHIERTQHYVRLLAHQLAQTPKYEEYMTAQYIEGLVKAAPLHDIGKVGVPDSILQKPGKLSPEEFAVIQRHCEYGTKVLELADSKLTFQSFLKIAIQIVRSHHEKWDGSGYPAGLEGEAIPLSGRIMAVADVYDALRSRRCYKPAMSHESAMQIFREESGKQFDPCIVDALCRCEHDFARVAAAMDDSELRN